MMTELNSRYSENEELANALSHLIGALLAIAPPGHSRRRFPFFSGYTIIYYP